MAYRLAQLINQAETDDSAKEPATDLVLRLWQLRSDWPNGWPPAAIKSQLGWLFPPQNRPARRPVDNETRLMRAVTDSLTKEYRLWLNLASRHGLKLTPAEETILAEEPTVTRDMIRWLMELDNQREAKPTAAETHEKLESIFRDRRSLLHRFGIDQQ